MSAQRKLPSSDDLPRDPVLHGGVDARPLAPRFAVLFLAGCVVFGVPALWPTQPGLRVAGTPLLFVYLFSAWAVFIGALAWLLESAGRRPRSAPDRADHTGRPERDDRARDDAP